MPHSFNVGLLRIARQARGWSQSELARVSGVSQAHLSKLENGITPCTDEVVSKLAQSLQFPESFFFQADRAVGLPVSVHPMYRKKASVGQKATERLEAELNIRLLFLKRLLSAVEYEPELPLPDLDIDAFGGDPEHIAELVRRAWLVPSGPLPNLVNWVERAGCIVIHCDFSDLAVDGVTIQYMGLPACIFLNKAQPADRQRFSLAHELGHIIMHRMPSPNMEAEANAFAAALLMPARDVRGDLAGKLTIQRLAVLKPIWRVSMNALLYRAKTIGAITDNQSSYLWRQLSSLGYRTSEPPELDLPLEQPTILPEILRVHLEDLGYELNDLCKVLHSSEEDVRRMLPLPSQAHPHLRLVK